MSLHDSLFRFSLLLLFVPVLLGAVFGCIVTWAGLRRRAAMQAWPMVEVTVLSGEVEESEYRSWYFTRVKSWDFIIDFEYVIGGRSYRSQVRLEADVPGGGRNPAPEILDNAVAQARRRLLDNLVTVRANPDDPSEVAWISETPGRSWLRLAAFVAAALVSLTVLTKIFTS